MLLYWLLILIIPIAASANVKMTYSKYEKISNRRGYTADEVARKILDSNGLYSIRIEHIKGNLTDHFDPQAGVIRLSDSVYGKTSVAAIGVAAHECGHAVQHAESYGPIVLRNKLVPITNFCSSASYILILVGILLSFNELLINIGIILFLAVVAFQLVTLPVEFNASSRALQTLEGDAILDEDEVGKSKKVLRAAALTYVASLLTTIIQLLRLIAMSRRRS
ncbi:MAG: zinc metallopeptidase [Ruminococcus sp.]|nr:zinc metallopeptidase [Ruminococcus sp.]MCD7811243.1 zinc metallopeptidase [Ruminococcus sp.]